jgi:hypothetical protein
MKHRAPDTEPDFPDPVKPVSDLAAWLFLVAVVLAVTALFVGVRILFL